MKTTNKTDWPPFICYYKRESETPLQALTRLREEQPELKTVPIAYAGRLDPMAEGWLLFLIGEECKNQSHYHDLDKTYEFTVLLGVSSDTQDILGSVKLTEPQPASPAEEKLEAILETLTGSITLPYPTFSSKTVRGKPLFLWTLEDRLDEITIPTRTSVIHSLTLNKIESVSQTKLKTEITRRITLLPSVHEESKALGQDFRRPAVLSTWEKVWEKTLPDTQFPIIHLTCVASSGTYMRTLAALVGKKLGTEALALRIKRTAMGHYQSGQLTPLCPK